MSNIYPIMDRIPSVEDERPVTQKDGFVFANPAYHARHDDLWPPKAGEEPPRDSWRQAIDLYLANFCRPVRSIANEVKCFACNMLLTKPYAGPGARGLTVDPHSPTLEGRCDGCGWPVRCRHEILTLPTEGSQPLVRLDYFPMSYHPSAIERKLNS